ncbi:hypothetical protein IB267_26870 [Ensifer sp. ENS09]|uniref:hypothetical protein n=1 Tax=Ensifer sp. ENS09 TaxID=2769263 RepID=UPI00178464E1|nr:hypothetical protein [Ensifer sp. ENS09]MBD9651987.1 hypothetical protein [Ensifer sp. ENS09]
MIRTFTIETSEADEKALTYSHPSGMVEFAFNSVLTTVVNSARDQLLRHEREAAANEGRTLTGSDDAIISASTAPDADARNAQALAKAEQERAEMERTKPLTARQLRLGLVNNGFALADVDVAIEALPDGAEKEKARIEWQYAGEFNRDHPLLTTIAAQLGISAEQFETMWVEALKL